MGILVWVLLGLVAGWLAKYILPGRAPGGVIWTILLGIAGALVRATDQFALRRQDRVVQSEADASAK